MTTHCVQNKSNSSTYFRDRKRKLRQDPIYREKENERQRKYRAANPEIVRESSRRSEQKRRWKKYSITEEIWNNTFINQDMSCAICGTTEPGSRGWHTDHCHTTNKFRGILCSSCNLLLGNAKEYIVDKINILQKSIQYLERNFLE